jgi:hypothetical protein
MYFLDTATATASIHDFWDTFKALLPVDVHIVVDPSGDTIEDTTGDLVGSWAGDPQDEIVGTDTTPYAAPVGAMVNWTTGTVLDGHRLRGKSYIVPITGQQFQNDGSLGATALTLLGGAATEFVIEQSASFVIWHRPRDAKAADGSRPAVTARAGGHAVVTGNRVPDFAAVLRSRRD